MLPVQSTGHIKLIAPRENALDYSSCYQQHDFIIQAVVDGRGKFIDAVCGFPGRAHDARVLRNSELYYNAERGNILQAPVVAIGGRDIRPYLVGDISQGACGYALKPFPEGTTDPEEQTFNKEEFIRHTSQFRVVSQVRVTSQVRVRFQIFCLIYIFFRLH